MPAHINVPAGATVRIQHSDDSNQEIIVSGGPVNPVKGPCDSIAPAAPVDDCTKAPVARSSQVKKSLDEQIAFEDRSPFDPEAFLRDAEDVEPEASMTPPAEVKKQNDLEEIHKKLSEKIDTSIKNNEIDFEHLHATIMQLAMLSMRMMAQQIRGYNMTRQKKITEDAEEVRESHKKKSILAWTMVAGTAQVAAGFFGCAQLAPTSLISEGTAKTLGAVATPLATTGQGIGTMTAPFTEAQRGMTHYLQTKQSQTQERHSQAESDRQGQKTAAEHMRDLGREHMRQVHDAVSSVLGG